MSTDLFMISPLIPEISADTGVSIQKASLVTSVFAAAYMIFGPVVALLSERYTRRAAISAGVALFGVGSLMAGVSYSFSLVLVGRVIAAIGASLIPNPPMCLRLSSSLVRGSIAEFGAHQDLRPLVSCLFHW